MYSALPEYIINSRIKFKETKDCTVVAWSLVFNCEYSKAHAYLKQHGRPNRRGMFTKEITSALKACKKSKIVFGPYSGSNRISIKEFLQKHNKGRYYILVRGHAIAVVDGVLYDYKEGMRRQITFAARVYLEGEI